MIVQFDTTTLTEKDAQHLLTIVSPYASQSLIRSLSEVDAVRHEARASKPDFIEAPRTTGDATTEPEQEPAKKRGRPRKEVVEVRPTDAADAAGPTLFDTPANGSAAAAASAPVSPDQPITLDDLREAVNEHVSRSGMPSAQLVLKKFGCERVTAVMELPPTEQRKVLAALGK